MKKEEKSQKHNESDADRKPKHDGFGKRLIIKLSLRIVTILLLLGALFFGSKFGFTQLLKISVDKKHAMVERELSEVAELTLYKMRYSDIATIKKRNIVAKAYSIVRYVGTVRAGIQNIAAAEVFISDDGKAIDVILPRSEILGNDITSQEVFDEQRSIFLPITTQEIFDEIDAAKKEMATALQEDGLLDESDERARKLVTHLLEKFGFKEINVVTRQENPVLTELTQAVEKLTDR